MRCVLAVIGIALLGCLLHALIGRMGVVAGFTVWGLGLCALWLLVMVLIAVAESPEEPR